VAGVDFVGRAVRAARRKAKQAGVQVDFHADDVTRLRGVSGPFDLVLDIGCLHSLSRQQKAVYTDNLVACWRRGARSSLCVCRQDEMAQVQA
jgi:2-polyprenyl-3-methyl-5-hydroxy-6-metoxy-1,4-benzoquinol methylase